MNFQIEIQPLVIVCYQVDKPLPRSRLLFQGRGVEFYVRGAIGKRFDAIANLAVNQFIELGYKAIDLRTVK